MKKLLLTLGAVASVAAPVAAVVACSSDTTNKELDELFSKFKAQKIADMAKLTVEEVTDKKLIAAIESLTTIKEDDGVMIGKVERDDHKRFFFKAAPKIEDQKMIQALEAPVSAISDDQFLQKDYKLTDEQAKESMFYVDVFTGTLVGGKVDTTKNYRVDTKNGNAHIRAVFGELVHDASGVVTGQKGLVSFIDKA